MEVALVAVKNLRLIARLPSPHPQEEGRKVTVDAVAIMAAKVEIPTTLTEVVLMGVAVTLTTAVVVTIAVTLVATIKVVVAAMAMEVGVPRVAIVTGTVPTFAMKCDGGVEVRSALIPAKRCAGAGALTGEGVVVLLVVHKVAWITFHPMKATTTMGEAAAAAIKGTTKEAALQGREVASEFMAW